MSKAFDKINLNRLIDACKRIGIPQNALNLIYNLYSNQKARIITAYGLTEPINLYSSIEQGETYSPLLWKIYYDPILTFINNKYQNSFLQIKSLSLIDQIFNKNLQPLTIPPLAFIDNTVWHYKNPTDLQNLLNDVSKLYQINNIQVNPTKSDLLHINSNKTKLTPIPQILFNNQPIYLCKPEEIIRYLGIYYDG